MRYALALVAAALVAPAALRAADPPITFQTQPLNRVLDDVRAAADLIGGERAVKGFNDKIKEEFGDKGFEGLDLSRPIAGYVQLAPKAADAVAVIAFPVTNEKDFVELCDRVLEFPPKSLGKGMYALPAIDPKHKARMKFADGYAYVAYGVNPEPALDAKALVPLNKVIDPADQAIFASKFHFDRLTPEVKLAIPGVIAELRKELGLDGKDGPDVTGVTRVDNKLILPVIEQFEKMFTRYALLLGGGESAALRVGLDVAAGEFSVEATLKGKPDTLLATAIAARKPTGNKFAALLTPDTVAGFKTRLPFFNDELRTATVKGIEAAQKEAGAPPIGKDLVDELFKGLIRTVKTGEVDVVGAVRGPNKTGDYDLVVAVAFDDPSALGKEFKKLVESGTVPIEGNRFKWDADKLGKVDIHTFKMPEGRDFFDFNKPFGDEKATLAFAFAPNGVFVVVGADPVPAMKAALAVKPVESPVLDVVLNPARMKKFVDKAGGPGLEVERTLGTDDKLLSAASLDVTGGKELKVRFGLNLRVLPKAIFAGEDGKPQTESVPFKK
ncbi:hypothetical protein GobsT_04650 [Gemmata obscuriglobus]|uniref:DUF3352 domain-containing protein n=1 Tax=Gemmata obscuriglobus TaxID=114 RepID=A0A2Z3H940_9BACT|nr:hypothetical protein [Gemmata obscuriglobus]AWM40952.1 hypothetical protein C1280_30860 [Gemmata obscuriglobus]QEG25738.1 hypothetical protein GobsT_04650 [Gemmata obscuriglobus]VTR99491.1 unnamed protein product [Gemmata obscuriglobus UQM 2246]